MRANTLPLLGFVGLTSLSGCFLDPIGTTDMGMVSSGDGMGCTQTNPDLAPPAAKCKAAQGLAGDNLICVDFDKVTSLTDPALMNWDFNASSVNCSDGWSISSGKLQTASFQKLTNATCGVLMPAAGTIAQYKSATISFIHKIDVIDQQDSVQIYLGKSGQGRQVYYGSGKNMKQRTILEINSADFPVGVSNYQLLLLLSTGDPGSTQQNWFIESIAINGNP